MAKLEDLRTKVRELVSKLASVRHMRKGWVGERLMKCGKKECACHRDQKARHGPYFTMTVPGEGEGKTQSRYLAPELVPMVREQIEAMKAFKNTVKALEQTAERWADAELEQAQAASEEAAKKGAFKSPSPRKSKPK